jgi:hypothetical protein
MGWSGSQVSSLSHFGPVSHFGSQSQIGHGSDIVEEMSFLSCINGAAQDDRVSLVDVLYQLNFYHDASYTRVLDCRCRVI